ncbi:MAG: UDP-N-acetylmuramate dehydrogenase [Candidatus Pacebacteria bacterium]|nr:UDP-N-acetylmuramate dehydrogenase [Candidatus Paceibacterota bacterium]
MEIKKNYNLSKLNTFGIDVNTDFFAEIKSENDIEELFSSPEFKHYEKIFLGGGSNILFTKDFHGIVILNKLKGIEITEESNESVSVRAMGGEIWNDLVLFAVNHGYWGIENLSLVPGTVGAAPMQNIGAYGSEIKETLLNVETFEVATGKKKIFNNEECELGYRDSIFKNKVKGKYFISAITLKLSKKENKNVTYRALKEYLENNKIEIHNSKDISEAVASIRNSKLPDPKILGNAGSFFKNVFIKKDELQKLLLEYPDIPSFEEKGLMKIPAGWLIEQCGWKGRKLGNVGVHEKQALVLVNYGNATGSEVFNLANQIIKSVRNKFGLELIPEVNLI